MRWNEIVNETSSSGGTGAGCVATATGTTGKGAIGVGFDPNGHKGIYDAAEKKKKRKSVETAIIPLIKR
jgi:hypothetical protein